jgi:hypothetical protein
MATVTIELLDFEQMSKYGKRKHFIIYFLLLRCPLVLLFTFAAFIMRCVWIIVYHKREPVIPETPLSKFTSGKWNPGLEAYVWYRVSDFKRRKERRKRKEAGAWKRARHGAEVQRKWAARRAAAARATGQSTALVPYHIQFVDNAVRQENPVKIV